MTAPPGPPAPAYREPAYDRYDEPTYGGFEPREPARPGMLGSEDDRFAADMTSEMRLGDPGGPPPLPPSPRAPEPPRPSFAGPPPPAGPGGPPPGLGPRGASGPPPMGSPAGPGYGPGMGGSDEPVSGELARLDQLRRSFQPRRFGSGYDRDQVDRLFDQLMAAVSGRGPVTVSDVDLDPKRFDLVPGGYFEAEVEQALEEVRDILRRL